MMRNMTGWLTLSSALALLFVLPALDGDAAMSGTVKPPAVVQLDFLKYIKESPSWLADELRTKGYRDGWKIAGDVFTTSDLEILRYVQRIKAFCFLDRSRTLPYFELELQDADGKRATCVTLYPRDILPELTAEGFRTEVFSVTSLDTEEINGCKVPESPAGTSYADSDRGGLRETFFGKFGELNMETFERFDGDPGFIHHAISLGYYPFQAQFTGYLQIALDE